MKSYFFGFLAAALHFYEYAQDLSTEIMVARVYRSVADIERGVRMEIQKGSKSLYFCGLTQGVDLNGGELQQANGKVSCTVRLEPGSSVVLPFNYSVRHPKNSFINLPQ